MDELIFIIGELLIMESNIIEKVVYPSETEFPDNLLAIGKDGKTYEISVKSLD
ncbi:MAG TPA: hypothetical protein VIL26_07630 [Clostridia bacterium]